MTMIDDQLDRLDAEAFKLRLFAAAKVLRQMIVAMNAEVEALQRRGNNDPRALTDLLTLYKLADIGHDELDDARKELHAALQTLSRETIPAAIAAEEDKLGRKITPVAIPDIGYKFSVSARVSASIIPEERSKAFKWLRSNQGGDLIQETVNASTLSAFAKDKLADEAIELPPELFKTTTMTVTSATKLPVKK